MWRLALICVGVIGCGSSPPGGDDDDVPPMPITADEAGAACVIFGSCMGDGVNDCFTDAMPFWTTAEARCVLAAAGDCTAVRSCFGFSAAADAACSATRSVFCDGDNLVMCGDGVRSSVSCPDAGLALRVGTGATCVQTATGALCGDASCSAPSATCDGSVAKVCNTEKGVLLSVDCAPFGQSCINGACTSSGGGGTCVTGPASCDGAALVQCSGGVELRTDCSGLVADASCFPSPDGRSQPYCGLGNACYPLKGAETCNGNAVTFCAAGATATIDCTTLGFTRCIAGHCSSF